MDASADEERMKEKLGNVAGATVGNTKESKRYQNETANGEINENADTVVSEDDVESVVSGNDDTISKVSTHRPVGGVDEFNRSVVIGVPERFPVEQDVFRSEDAITIEVPGTIYKTISDAIRLGISKDSARRHIINVRSGTYVEDTLILNANVIVQARFGHQVTIKSKVACTNAFDIRHPGCKLSGLKVVRSGAGKTYSNKAYCAVVSASGVEIRHCHFEGGGIWLKHGSHSGLVLEDVSVSGARSNGIYATCKTPHRTMAEGNFPAHDVCIRRCRLSRCQGHGLCLQTPAAVLCEQLSIRGSSGCGVKLSFGVYADIKWSRITESGGIGVDVDAFDARKQSLPTDVLLSHCEVLECGKHCVSVGTESLAQIEHNTFHNPKEEALQITDVHGAMVQHNTVLPQTLGKVHQAMLDLQADRKAQKLAAKQREDELQKQQALYKQEQNAAIESDVCVCRCPSTMYPTLMKAIECASKEERTIILIKEGTYALPKTLVVQKPITLQAAHQQKVVLTTVTPGVPVIRIQSKRVVLREVVVKWNASSHGVGGAEHGVGGAEPASGPEDVSFKRVLPRLAQTAITKSTNSADFESGLMSRMRRGLALGRHSLGIRSFHPAPLQQFQRLKPRRRWTNRRSETLDFLTKGDSGGCFDENSQANVAACKNRMAVVVSVGKTLIERCTLLGGGLWVRGGQDGVAVVESKIEGGARIGLWMQTEACRARLVGTAVRGCISWGMVCEKEAAPDLLKCTLEGNGDGGALFRENAKGVIRHTRVVGNGGDGVRISGRGTDPTVEDSEIASNKGNGVYVLDSGKGTLARNVLFEQTYRGIVLASHEGTVLIDNTDKDKIERERRAAMELAARQKQEQEEQQARAAAEAKAEADRIMRIYGSARGSPKHRKRKNKFKK